MFIELEIFGHIYIDVIENKLKLRETKGATRDVRL